MKIQHQLFAHHYILTGDKDKAYSLAYPNACGEAAKVTARRLLNNPDVRNYISQRLAEAQLLVLQQKHDEEQRRLEEESASLLQKRKLLQDIISGRRKQRRHFRFKDYIETIEDEVDVMVLLRAIDIDTKLACGWYDKKRGKDNKKEEQSQQVIGTNPGVRFEMEVLSELQFGPDYVPGLRAAMVRDNPRKAEEYRKAGLRVLDHVPDLAEEKRMKAAQDLIIAEWRELKKFADEQLDDEPDENIGIIDETIPEPPSIISLYPQHVSSKESRTQQSGEPCLSCVPIAIGTQLKSSPLYSVPNIVGGGVGG